MRLAAITGAITFIVRAIPGVIGRRRFARFVRPPVAEGAIVGISGSDFHRESDVISSKEVHDQVVKYRGRRVDPLLWLGPGHVPIDDAMAVLGDYPFPGIHEETPLVLFDRQTGVKPVVLTDRAMYAFSVRGALFGRKKVAKKDQGHQRIAIGDIEWAGLDYRAGVSYLRINDRWTIVLGHDRPGAYVLFSLTLDLSQLSQPLADRGWEPEVWLHDDLINESPTGVTTNAVFPDLCVVCLAAATTRAAVPLGSNSVKAFSLGRFLLSGGWSADKTFRLAGQIDVPYCDEHAALAPEGIEKPQWGAGGRPSADHIVLELDDKGQPYVAAIGLRFANPDFASQFADCNGLPLG